MNWQGFYMVCISRWNQVIILVICLQVVPEKKKKSTYLLGWVWWVRKGRCVLILLKLLRQGHRLLGSISLEITFENISNW